MDHPIRIGIVGYGNLGRGVETALQHQPDMTLTGVYTRRDPTALQTGFATTPVHAMDRLEEHGDAIDVLILCGGSREDLPRQGPELAAHFSTVDSFDTHQRIPEYFSAMDAPARQGGHTALISVGWDPGLFSLQRMLGEALLPRGNTYTFWGKGLSQGHSDAVRRVPGVRAGVQYTLPSIEALEQVRSGQRPALTPPEQHVRECYVVLEEGADPAEVEQAIVTMPHYFADYSTRVHFLSEEELRRDHADMPHGGYVLRSGDTSADQRQMMEFSLKLGSNPEFTASVLVACARATHRLNRQGQHGAFTLFDVAPGLLSPEAPEALRRRLL